jgi:hypothetical protein
VAGWSFVAGKFTGSERGPAGDGTIWVGKNTGKSFDWGSSPWVSVSPTSGWTLVCGRFSGGRLTILSATTRVGTARYGWAKTPVLVSVGISGAKAPFSLPCTTGPSSPAGSLGKRPAVAVWTQL